MYALYLNPVTSNAETYVLVAYSDSQERLEQYLNDESCDGYNDGRYYRSFKDGPLYNYNPPQMDGVNCFGVNEGIVEILNREEYAQRCYDDALEIYDNMMYSAIMV